MVSPTSRSNLVDSDSASFHQNRLRATFYGEEAKTADRREPEPIVSQTERVKRLVASIDLDKVSAEIQQMRTKPQASEASLKPSSFSTPNDFSRFG